MMSPELCIQQGFSDWVVSANINSYFTTYDDKTTINYTESEVEVQYNISGSEHARVALVIYGQDGDNQWHIGGTFADESGNVKFSELIYENSKYRDVSLFLYTSMFFKQEAGIRHVVNELVVLKPGQTTVPLEPSANFTMPDR